MTLHIYTRVSSDRQIPGHSLEVQEELGIKKAKSFGMGYVIHREEGRSAFDDTTLNRPVLENLIDMCKKGKVKHLFCSDLDRLSRNVKHVIGLAEVFDEHNVILYTESSKLDLMEPDQRLHTLIQTIFSEHESRKRVRKIVHSLENAVRKGVWIGVMVPYGYRKTSEKILEIDEEEAEVYKKIVDLTLKGYGTNTVAKEMNKLSIPTKASKVLKYGINLPKTAHRYHERVIKKEEIEWAPNTIRSILLNPIYKGERRYKKELLDVPHLAIIDSETWEKLQVQHKNNKNHSQTERKHFYLLKGLLRCGHCNRNLVGRIKTDENYYQCASKRSCGCDLRSPNITVLDNFIWQTVLSFPVMASQSAQIALKMRGSNDISKIKSRVETIEMELRRIESRLKNLVLLFETERIDLDEFDSRKTDLTDDKQKLLIEKKNHETKMATSNSNEDRMMQICMELGNPRAYMKNLSDAEKKEVLCNVVENIEVNWITEMNSYIVKIHLKIFDMNYSTTGIMQKGKNFKQKIQDSPESVLKTLLWIPM